MLRLVEILEMSLFSFAGGIEAERKGMDLIGIYAVAFKTGVPPFISVLMAVITAAFGGVIRDIVCNEVPVIFKRGQFYATCSLIAGLVYWACEADAVEFLSVRRRITE